MKITATGLAQGIANCLTEKELEQLHDSLLDGLMARDADRDGAEVQTPRQKKELEAVSELLDCLAIVNCNFKESI